MKTSTNHLHNTAFPKSRHFQVARDVLRRIEQHGEQAFIVGGAVRDWLLQRDVKDIDIATSATPDTVRRLFEKNVPTGIAHGTVSIHVDDCWFEVTTFRKEGPYEDGRHPKYVSFDTDLAGDLARRDFTINAMAMDANGIIIDPFDGKKDLGQGLIRAVGDPYLRFQEDGLRVARAFRFAAMLDFTVDERTWEALSSSAALLRQVAAERRQEEWSKFLEVVKGPLCGSLPNGIAEAWTGSRINGFSAWCPALSALEGLTLRTALIVWKLEEAQGGVDGGRKYLQAMRYSNKFTKEVLTLTRLARLWLEEPFPRMTLELGKILAEYGDAFLPKVIRLCTVLRPAFAEAQALEQVKKLLEQSNVRQLRDLAVRGSDLADQLSMRGAEIGDALSHLFTRVVEMSTDNTKFALLEQARIWQAGLPLSGEAIRQSLRIAPNTLPLFGFAELSSTNDEARARIAAGAVEALAVFTDRQTGGRGRQGKAWLAPAGASVALSIALKIPHGSAGAMQTWPLAAALAVRNAIAKMGAPDALVKWPNDIFIAGKKVCGILTEMRTAAAHALIIVGIGVNVNSGLEDFPEGLRPRVISLKMALHRPVSRNLLIAGLIDEYFHFYQNWKQGMRFRDWKKDYETHCLTLGQRIRIQQGHQVVEGQAVKVDAEGTLWIDVGDNTLAPIRSGEIIE